MHDRQQPRSHLPALGVEARRLAPKRDEGFLHGILGGPGIARNPQREPVRRARMPVVQRRERRIVTRLYEAQQHAVVPFISGGSFELRFQIRLPGRGLLPLRSADAILRRCHTSAEPSVPLERLCFCAGGAPFAVSCLRRSGHRPVSEMLEVLLRPARRRYVRNVRSE